MGKHSGGMATALGSDYMDESTCSIDGCEGRHMARSWCHKHYKRWRRYGDPEAATRAERRAASEAIPGRKTCSKCGANKPLDDFHDKHGRGHKMNHCRECHALLLASNYQAKANYYGEKRSQWKAANVDRVMAQARVDASRRRARLRGVEVDPSVSIEAVRERDGDDCAYCGVAVWFGVTTPGDLLYKVQATLDHVIPISRGGGHIMSNVKIACRDCNGRKLNKTPEEWQPAASV